MRLGIRFASDEPWWLGIRFGVRLVALIGLAHRPGNRESGWCLLEQSLDHGPVPEHPQLVRRPDPHVLATSLPSYIADEVPGAGIPGKLLRRGDQRSLI